MTIMHILNALAQFLPHFQSVILIDEDNV